MAPIPAGLAAELAQALRGFFPAFPALVSSLKGNPLEYYTVRPLTDIFHLPYMPSMRCWQVYTAAGKLGDFLEWRYPALELTAWTNSPVDNIERYPEGI